MEENRTDRHLLSSHQTVLKWQQKPLESCFVLRHLFTAQQGGSLCARAERAMQAGSATSATGSGLLPDSHYWMVFVPDYKVCKVCSVMRYFQPGGNTSQSSKQLILSTHIIKFNLYQFRTVQLMFHVKGHSESVQNRRDIRSVSIFTVQRAGNKEYVFLIKGVTLRVHQYTWKYVPENIGL